MNSSSAKEARLVARASVEVQELIKAAAELSGATISQFIIEAATTRAHNLIEKTRSIRLSLEGANNLFEALDNPPAPNQRLLDAASKFKKRGFHFVNHNNVRKEGSQS